MFPRFGYTTAAWEPPKPPGRGLDRVGKPETTPIDFSPKSVTEDISSFGGVAGRRARYYDAGQGELLIRNSGAEENEGFRDHPSVFSSDAKGRCWGRNSDAEPVLRHKVLAARETTDVLILEWPNCSGLGLSLGQALLLAGARLLEIDVRELSKEIISHRSGSESIFLYDSTAGGAGHCFELSRPERQRPWLEMARQILFVSERHDKSCERACLECLLDFGGQFDAEKLDRCAALRFLDPGLGVLSG